MSETRLVGRKELGERHPFLANRWRLNYLIRTGQLPCVKVGQKNIAFDLAQIEAWIAEHTRKEVSE